jgi:hypothetical protein
LQPWQVEQVLAQQIFEVPSRLSTHFPLAQSPAARHVSPLFFLHAPVSPHVFVPVQVVPVVSSALETTMLHVPVAPQFWQAGQVDCVQHTPSRQVNPV